MAAKRATDKPPLRLTAGDRRQQILEVAIRLFSQKGFRGTTTKEIALAAGVNEAIIFRHFATKDDLYSAILDQKASSAAIQALEEAVETAMQARDDRQVFESLAFHILESHERDDAFMRLLFYSALERHELADIFFRTQVTNYYRRLASYVKQRIADGDYRRVDPMTAVRAFLGMVIYHAQINKFYDRDLLNISNRQAAERFTDIFLTGILNPAPNGKRR
jgi:AcrR family transcriptional regulator